MERESTPQVKYDAFISYRHTPLDMEIAKKVHTALETYHVPGAVQKKTGKKKIRRVFRDQEELPIGSDLDDNISGALANSEYLIVICSPNTPESYWVCKEIETFIQMHGREHILAVLIEGEPDESFPPQLLVDDYGNNVEPLAADVRGTTPKERNQKFRTEILRLAAPVLGCTYDDLRQRHRERMIRRTVALVSGVTCVVAIAAVAFGIYNAGVAARMKALADEKALLADEKTLLAEEKSQLADEKTQLAEEILQEFRDKQENQSRFYAEEALSLLESGDRRAAVLVAKAGLPSDTEDRPYVAESEYALSEALHAYDTGKTMSFDRVLKHDLTVSEIGLSGDGEYLVSRDSGSNVYVWDTKTMELLLQIPARIDGNNYRVSVSGAVADQSGVYVAANGAVTKYGYDKEVLFENTLFSYIRDVTVHDETGQAVAWGTDEVAVMDRETGREQYRFEMPEDMSLNSYSFYDPTSNCLVLAEYGTENTRTGLLLADTTDPEKQYRKVLLSSGYVLDMCMTQEGNIAVISCNSDFAINGLNDVYLDLVDMKRAALVWSHEIDARVRSFATFSACIENHCYDSDGEKKSDIVVTIEYEAFVFDEKSGQMRPKLSLPAEAVTLHLARDNSFGYIGCSNGDIQFIDFGEGRVYSDYAISTDVEIFDQIISKGRIFIRGRLSTNVYVLKYHEAPDLEKIADMDNKIYLYYLKPTSEYFALSRDDKSYDIYDLQGNAVSTFDESGEYSVDVAFQGDRFLFMDYENVFYMDPETGECEKVPFSDMGLERRYFYGSIGAGGTRAVLWGFHDIVILDLEERRMLLSINMEDDTVGKVVIAPDGSAVYAVMSGKNLMRVDAETGEVREYEEDSLREVSDCFSMDFMSLSPDGTLFAMFCEDGNVRVFDLKKETILAEIPIQAKRCAYIEFMEDGRKLILQGDDYKVRIWDMETGGYLKFIDALDTIRFTVPDPEDGLFALCDGARTYLIETGSFGLTAAVEGGYTYLKDTNTFIVYHSGSFYRTAYKSYKELLEEAERQFPGAVMTDEEKAMFNVD